VECVEVESLGVAIKIADGVDEDTLIGAELLHVEVLAGLREKLAPSARRVLHAVKVAEKKVAILASVFVAFGTLAVDRRLVGVDGALNECHSDVILEDIEAGYGCRV